MSVTGDRAFISSALTNVNVHDIQLRSGKLLNGKRVGTHGNLHHLINGGDFGFLERIPENRRRVYTGHPLTTHICAVQSVHKRGTHTTRLAQITRIAFHLCAREKILSSGVAHVSSLVVLSPAFHHEHITLLMHSSLYHDTRTRSIIGTTRSTPRTPSTSRTSPSSLSRQEAPYHSGVKTCRVAETRAPQLPQVMCTKNLRLSQESKLILEVHINYLMYRTNLEKKIYELLSPKNRRNLERFGQLACGFLKYQRRPTSNRRCI